MCVSSVCKREERLVPCVCFFLTTYCLRRCLCVRACGVWRMRWICFAWGATLLPPLLFNLISFNFNTLVPLTLMGVFAYWCLSVSWFWILWLDGWDSCNLWFTHLLTCCWPLVIKLCILIIYLHSLSYFMKYIFVVCLFKDINTINGLYKSRQIEKSLTSTKNYTPLKKWWRGYVRTHQLCQMTCDK